MLNYATTSRTGFTKQSYADGLLLLNMMLGFKAHPDTLVLKDKRFYPSPLEFPLSNHLTVLPLTSCLRNSSKTSANL
jgi:hypothetical protein